MRYNLYVVGIRWIKTPLDTAKVDALLGANGDWYRFNGYTWLFWTELDHHQAYSLLRPQFHTDDSLLILKADPSVYQGWAPKELWDWLAKKASMAGRGA